MRAGARKMGAWSERMRDEKFNEVVDREGVPRTRIEKAISTTIDKTRRSKFNNFLQGPAKWIL